MASGSFSLDVSAFAKKARTSMSAVMQRVSTDLFLDIVKRTPVDTGRARGSWTVGLYALPGTYNTAKDKDGGGTITQGQAVIRGFEAGQGSIFLVTNLVYMPALEYGHSKAQAPHGMVRIAARRYQKILRDAVRGV